MPLQKRIKNKRSGEANFRWSFRTEVNNTSVQRWEISNKSTTGWSEGLMQVNTRYNDEYGQDKWIPYHLYTHSIIKFCRRDQRRRRRRKKTNSAIPYLYLLGGPLRRRDEREAFERELYSWLSIWVNRRSLRRRESTSVSKYLGREERCWGSYNNISAPKDTHLAGPLWDSWVCLSSVMALSL